MKVLIDKRSVEIARLINRAAYEDIRRYYLIDSALVVVRNNLDFHTLVRQVVDVTVGWDIAMQGFCVEGDEGKKRVKVTIYRTLRDDYARNTLAWVIAKKNYELKNEQQT